MPKFTTECVYSKFMISPEYFKGLIEETNV